VRKVRLGERTGGKGVVERKRVRRGWRRIMRGKGGTKNLASRGREMGVKGLGEMP